MKRISEVKKEEIRALIRRGWERWRIAEKCGVSEGTVTRFKRELAKNEGCYEGHTLRFDYKW